MGVGGFAYEPANGDNGPRYEWRWWDNVPTRRDVADRGARRCRMQILSSAAAKRANPASLIRRNPDRYRSRRCPSGLEWECGAGFAPMPWLSLQL